MEQRLIDANALREKWLCLQGHDFSPSSFVYSIDNEPTVDAVPVVRCRECIHRPKMPDNYVDGFDLEFPDHKCPCQCEDGFYSWYPADDWFCADGERRSELGNDRVTAIKRCPKEGDYQGDGSNGCT